MKKNSPQLIATFLLFLMAVPLVRADRKQEILNLAVELEKQALFIAQSSFIHFKGGDDALTAEELTVLFRSEAFLASCRLFLRMADEQSDFFPAGFLRTNLYNAYLYLIRSLQDLEEVMRKAGVMPYALSDCRNIFAAMDAEFSKWPAAENLASLHQKYVKAGDGTLYMIERRDGGRYVRRPFKDLKSLYRFNYGLKRGKDPWKYLVEVSSETLEKMEEGEKITLTFEGALVIELGNRPNRVVYLIENGKKRAITSPRVLDRFGGWGKVFEVPAEVISKYPDGEPIL